MELKYLKTILMYNKTTKTEQVKKNNFMILSIIKIKEIK
jgi:hypothetical protein